MLMAIFAEIAAMHLKEKASLASLACTRPPSLSDTSRSRRAETFALVKCPQRRTKPFDNRPL